MEATEGRAADADGSAPAGPAPNIDAVVDNASRFQMELEFIQSLANPEYLEWLANRHYFRDEAFRSYLRYLTYWREPQYCMYIAYPHALAMLDLLQDDSFCLRLMDPSFLRDLKSTQERYWRLGSSE